MIVTNIGSKIIDIKINRINNKILVDIEYPPL